MLNKELTIGQDILEILLKDNTTKKNIIWATDEYSEIGNGAWHNILWCLHPSEDGWSKGDAEEGEYHAG